MISAPPPQCNQQQCQWQERWWKNSQNENSQKNDPEYLQIGLGGIDTADAEVVDKPGYGLDGKIGKELDEKLDKIQKELTELEFLYNNEQLG